MRVSWPGTEGRMEDQYRQRSMEGEQFVAAVNRF